MSFSDSNQHHQQSGQGWDSQHASPTSPSTQQQRRLSANNPFRQSKASPPLGNGNHGSWEGHSYSETSTPRQAHFSPGGTAHNQRNTVYSQDSSLPSGRATPSSHKSPKPDQHITFNPTIPTIEISEHEEVFDDNDDNDDNLDPAAVERKKTMMKRHRWGTQRHAKGRPKKDAPKRNKSIFSRSHSRRNQDRHGQHDTSAPSNHSSDSLEQEKADKEPHKVYYNMPLPEDMLDPETGAPVHQYSRNKIRTAKYTPLSFIPKNLFFQFQNVANVYFLFIVILGVCFLFLGSFFFKTLLTFSRHSLFLV